MRRLALIALAAILLSACGARTDKEAEGQQTAVEEEVLPPLGFRTEDFTSEEGAVRSGETFSGLMGRLGMGAKAAYDLATVCDTVFDVRKLRAGNSYTAYYSGDSLDRRLEYTVYHNDRIRSTIFKCADSLAVWTYDKPVEHRDSYVDVTIKSSLWNDFLEAGATPALVLEVDDIFAWTVDFFSLQDGDRFRTFYQETLVDGEVIGISKVDYARFSRGGSDICAIRYDQGDSGNVWWNEKGESMKKAFLKAPLKFTRISSKFSYNRKHPVYGTYRPHTAVDYAAPAGTPVYALGDGTVISAGWASGGGNTIKIRHNSVYTTSYMHLIGFAKGIKSGVHVRQGELIGYVGSTGTATGPHLDFRVWKNGTPIDPLKLESPSAEPAREESKPAIDSLWRMYEGMILEKEGR